MDDEDFEQDLNDILSRDLSFEHEVWHDVSSHGM
jgi:hypothetical protein